VRILRRVIGFWIVLVCAGICAAEDFTGTGVSPEPVPNEHDVIVKVTWSAPENRGTIEIDRQAFVAPEDILETLRAKAAADPETRVILRPGNGVPLDFGKEIVAAIRKAGITKLALSSRDILLPIATPPKDRVPAEPPVERLNIRVTWSAQEQTGSVEIEGRKFAKGDEIVEFLGAKAKEHPGLRVLIRADRDVRYEYLKEVMLAAGKAGVGKVTFSVVDNGTPVPAAKR
jgi:biopolymer transport protein ExbD